MIRSRRAFSLVELLVVISIIAVLTGIAVVTLGPATSVNLTSAGESVRGEMELARTTAQAQNRPVAVVFYELDGESTPAWRAMATYIWNDGDDSWQPASKPRMLPDNVVISSNATHSTLPLELDPADEDTAPPVPRTLQDKVNSMKYFTFRPNGMADLDNGTDWHVMIVDPKAPIVENGLPANWAMVQVQPLTGMVSLRRP